MRQNNFKQSQLCPLDLISHNESDAEFGNLKLQKLDRFLSVNVYILIYIKTLHIQYKNLKLQQSVLPKNGPTSHFSDWR